MDQAGLWNPICHRCSEPGRRLTAPPAARPAQLNRWAIRTRRFEKQTKCETADFAAPTIPGEELLSYGIGPRLRRFTFVLLHVRMELLLSAERLAARRTRVQAPFTAHLLHGLLPSLISAALAGTAARYPRGTTPKRRQGKNVIGSKGSVADKVATSVSLRRGGVDDMRCHPHKEVTHEDDS